MNDYNVLARNFRKCLFDAVLSERLSLCTIFLKYIFYKVRRCFEYILEDRDYWYRHFGSLFSLEGQLPIPWTLTPTRGCGFRSGDRMGRTSSGPVADDAAPLSR